ncbi:MAG: ATP-dependent RecD-like DNA helicase [Sphingomonas sp.]|uniref:AAA family ATPase n=1 Tax=Sphingomonas sp. TaxID=28214 RepID=UPI0026021536|nr:AAA family ATPase [Sphingomonas sp.]MDK2768391.1 ATP-dependent RecD-like DNA helicase [Sphingomonas sp.]
MSRAAVSVELTVTSFHPGPSGGGILIGWDRDDRQRPRRARLQDESIPRHPAPGETWRVTGPVVEHPHHGPQILAAIALPLLPSGGSIVRWIATSKAIPRVGERTALRLWLELGERLYDLLRQGDAAAMSPLVGPVAAADIVAAFAGLRHEVDVLQAFDRYGVEPRTAMAACTLWGEAAVDRLYADPYLVNAVEAWKVVDQRALRLGVAPDDPRRLIAAVGETCSRRYSGREHGLGGNLASTRQELETGVARLLGQPFAHLAGHAVDLALDAGELVAEGDLLQSRGCSLMERDVERLVRARSHRPRTLLAPDIIDGAIRSVEDEAGHHLEPAQRDAVHMAATTGFCVVDGGAGTGKTTVTLAILRAVRAGGGGYVQMALSGRAAKRLAEATGHEAMTVHRFLKGVVNGRIRIAAGTVVIDEASMIGTPDLWQILAWLPVEVDVVLVGDPGQLPPIAPGRPFAAAIEGSVARTTLTRIHRQAAGSDIPTVAAAIRTGTLLDLPDFDYDRPHQPGAFLVRVSEAATADAALATFERMAGPPPTGDRDSLRAFHAAQVQLLGATIHGPAGVTTLSDRIETRWMSKQQPISDWGLSVGSKILWTRNSYDRPASSDRPEDVVDLMNGSLGVVQRPTSNGAIVLFDDVDGSRAEVLRSDLRNIRRGWAVTVHKAQGSAFARVVMPISRSRLLDRLLIYTGLTRATTTVVLVGDEDLLRRALAAVPTSWSGRQTLRL